eukprot:5117968-Prymnesium_polylepis.1
MNACWTTATRRAKFALYAAPAGAGQCDTLGDTKLGTGATSREAPTGSTVRSEPPAHVGLPQTARGVAVRDVCSVSGSISGRGGAQHGTALGRTGSSRSGPSARLRGSANGQGFFGAWLRVGALM